MADEMSIRPATHQDMCEDMMMGDSWTLRRMQVDRRLAIEAATKRWGLPGASMLPGEMMWRLRVDEAVPVYISICPGEEPVAMFNFYQRPPRGVEEDILDLLGEMLTRGDEDEERPSSPPARREADDADD